MRFPRAFLLVLATSLLLPAASAHHPCEAMCLGGVWHEEGEGICPGDAHRSYFIVGGESHEAGVDAIGGAGWMCEDTGAGVKHRTGLFLYTWHDGEPTLLFFGIDERPSGCGVVAAVVYVEDTSPSSVFCTIA